MSRLIKSLWSSLPRLILVGSLAAIYLRTLAPGLTWANDGSDGGDLITAAATAGVPHPTGYPLYLLLARLFQFLPLGSLAFRTNLFSAMTTVFAAALVYTLVQHSSGALDDKSNWSGALVACYAVGLAPLIWSQAVIAEVYGLQVLLVALILYLYTKPSPTPPSAQKRLDYWRGLVLGLAMGNHVTTLFLIPAALLIGSVRERTTDRGETGSFKLDREAFLRQLGMLGLGLSIYLIIPLRAWAHPPVNWGNAVSLERFWWLVSGQLYQSYYLQPHWIEIWTRLQAWAALLLQQFGLPGVVLGFLGLIVFGERSRLFILTLWTAAVFTAFAIVYGSVDSYVYLLPVFLVFAIWIGFGIKRLAAQVGYHSDAWEVILSLLMLVSITGQSIANFHQVDASTDLRAEKFGEEVLSAAPPNAILFAEGDRAVFALWYFHWALGKRPDVAVIAADLLHFDWYQENLQAIYPSLIVPSPFPWPETVMEANPSRPACYVQYSDAAIINCSPERGFLHSPQRAQRLDQ